MRLALIFLIHLKFSISFDYIEVNNLKTIVREDTSSKATAYRTVKVPN